MCSYCLYYTLHIFIINYYLLLTLPITFSLMHLDNMLYILIVCTPLMEQSLYFCHWKFIKLYVASILYICS